MQGEKEMKGKVSTPIEWMVSTPRARCQGGRHTDILTDGQTDQPTRVLEFHMLYGTKKSCWLGLSVICEPTRFFSSRH